jgi:hypothetical protein
LSPSILCTSTCNFFNVQVIVCPSLNIKHPKYKPTCTVVEWNRSQFHKVFYALCWAQHDNSKLDKEFCAQLFFINHFALNVRCWGTIIF